MPLPAAPCPLPRSSRSTDNCARTVRKEELCALVCNGMAQGRAALLDLSHPHVAASALVRLLGRDALHTAELHSLLHDPAAPAVPVSKQPRAGAGGIAGWMGSCWALLAAALDVRLHPPAAALLPSSPACLHSRPPALLPQWVVPPELIIPPRIQRHTERIPPTLHVDHRRPRGAHGRRGLHTWPKLSQPDVGGCSCAC